MSQSLRAVKRFRIRELTHTSPLKNSRIPPAATAASNLHSSSEPSPPSRSGTGGTTLTLNPFVPHKNPESGRWAPPKYSLRRQADLIKHARVSGTLHLLPPGPKMSSAQQQQLVVAAAAATTSSVLGKDQVGLEDNVMRSGLVRLRRGEAEEVQAVQEREVAVAVAVEKEGEARGEALAPEPKKSLEDAQADYYWTMPVEWTGRVLESNVAGADVGNCLYAGKKRMFKGHKWERTRERRVGRTKMLLRDMDKRIERFKGYRAKGNPLPLARRNNVLKKTQKLPF